MFKYFEDVAFEAKDFISKKETLNDIVGVIYYAWHKATVSQTASFCYTKHLHFSLNL